MAQTKQQQKSRKIGNGAFFLFEVQIFGQEKGKEVKKQIHHGKKKRVVQTIVIVSHIMSKLYANSLKVE